MALTTTMNHPTRTTTFPITTLQASCQIRRSHPNFLVTSGMPL